MVEVTVFHNNDVCPTLCLQKDQKDKEMEKIQNLLNARCSQVEKLQRNLNDQTEQLESLKTQVRSLTEELDALKAEHVQCQQNGVGSEKLQEQVLELEHLLSREKTNAEVMMRAFQEQEGQWELEKTKMLSSLNKGFGDEQSMMVEENDQLKRKVEELERVLSDKDKEYLEALQQTERRASSRANVASDLQSKIRDLESQCEELKYSLKQKDEEIFIKEESLKQNRQEVRGLESKYAAAAEVERELRHHLGEVTQQLEWSKDDRCGAGDSNSDTGVAERERLKEALSVAEEEVQINSFFVKINGVRIFSSGDKAVLSANSN